MSAPDFQLVAADPGVSAFVTANAGSGKTKTLVDRVARLLLQGSAPEAVLCVTYTKAAASEMQGRLFEQLGGWAVLENEPLRDALAALHGQPREAFTEPYLARARRLFARALETPGGLKIQTIHAFCEKLLRRFPLEAGVSPGFRVAEAALAADLAAEARETVARLAMAAPDAPAGEAYAHFSVELDHASFQDMFLAFDAKRDAIGAYLARHGGGVVADVWARCEVEDPFVPEEAAEAFAAPPALDVDLWRRAAAVLNGGKDSDRVRLAVEHLAEGRPAWSLVTDALFTSDGTGTPRTWIAKSRALKDAGLCEPMLAEQDRLERARDVVRAGRVARNTVHALTLAAAYGEAYRQAKRANAALDFADLIAAARRLLTEGDGAAAWVLYKLDAGLDHVLVDEAQDTAPEQWEIVRALTGEFFAGSGLRDAEAAPRTVFAVGDEKQSIYSFQGARPERLLAEAQAYERLVEDAGAEYRGVTLAESWRSTDHVLKFVDAIFAEPDTRDGVPPPRGFDIIEHLPRRNQPGCVDIWDPYRDDKREDAEAWDAPLDQESPASARKRLARRIAREITDSCARGDRVWDKAAKGWRASRPGDFLVLVRRRDALFEEILRALKRAKLPVSGADRLKLSSHAVFQDLVALARFALYPDDDLTLAALLRSPFCDVDEQGLFDLAFNREGPLWRVLRDRADERPAWAAGRDFLGRVRNEARTRAPFDFFGRVLVMLDGEGRSVRRRILARLGGEADDALDAFLAEVLALERRGFTALETCVSALERAEVEVKRELDDAGEVRVMTVHGAKGLEAPVVVLPDTTSKLRPLNTERFFEDPRGGFFWCGRKAEDCGPARSARDHAQQKRDEENLRLFYVALTRARDRLIVCGRTPGNIGQKVAEEGSWWDRARRAFDRPEIAGATRPLEGGLRYGPDPEPAAAAAAAEAFAAALPPWVGVAPPAERGAELASPSGLLGKAGAPSPLEQRTGLGRFRRGDLIHKLLELLPDLPEAQRPTAAAAFLGKQPDLNDEQRAEMAAAALTVLGDARFAAVFGPGSRAEAAVAGEAPELPGQGFSGRLDRLLVTPERVLVVDFKTNRPAPSRIEDADEAYLAQMAVYVAVLRAVFPGRAVEAALLWTDGPDLMPVPDAVVESTLERLRAG
ncbi:MAG TPA: double-strand break repair helicase AddA [Caulobacteraceae bacterium]|jgi:ATP-dependent helicase/nuclease subunit A